MPDGIVDAAAFCLCFQPYVNSEPVASVSVTGSQRSRCKETRKRVRGGHSVLVSEGSSRWETSLCFSSPGRQLSRQDHERTD